MIKKLLKVKALNNKLLEIEFEDKKGVFDLKPYLHLEMFKDLNDDELFRKVSINFNTIQWPNGADFDPESLYNLI